jgi:hypothetical protein
MYFLRGKNKIKDPYTYIDMYKEYIKDKPENSPYYVEYSFFVELCNYFYKRAMEKLLYENQPFVFPFSLGTLTILKIKVKSSDIRTMPIDWKNTVKYGKTIYHLNEHSRGFKYIFSWKKIDKKFENKYFYRLVMTRDNKRDLARIIKTNKCDYFEMRTKL